jgi:elongation factor 3
MAPVTELVKIMPETWSKLTAAASAEERKAEAVAIANTIKSAGVCSFQASGLPELLQASLSDLKVPGAREGALFAYTALAEVVGQPIEPALTPLLALVLERYSDKVAPVREAAAAAGKAFTAILCPTSIRVILPTLLEALDAKKNWQTKTGSLAVIDSLTEKFPKAIAFCLPEMVPVISFTLSDAKAAVKTAALATITSVCKMVNNRDIEGVIPDIISCIARPNEVQQCVHKLGATTFVQQVESPALAILVPLLLRGLRERVTAIKRKSCVIIDNMAKLVDNPMDATVFLPRLLPEVEKVAVDTPDPECRQVAEKALKTLKQVADDASAVASTRVVTQPEVLAALTETIAAATPEGAAPVLEHVAALCTALCNTRNWEPEAWEAAMLPYLGAVIAEADAAAVCKKLLARCLKEEEASKAVPEEEEDEGEELCNCEFSLAYGGKILLNNASLRLKRGKRYGLCGRYGVGKSTLMRAIANGQLDGFPSKDVLRTVYVEHDIDGSVSDLKPADFISQDANIKDVLKSDDIYAQVKEELAKVGFTPELLDTPVGSLSGGWKMKLALARAVLINPDIMLLDEPTNHLDVLNVQWLENHLTSLDKVTSIVVSHDSGFLDNVCTNIIHYESRKLKIYKGNLSEFVKKKPEAKSYYELASTQIKFVLPEPGFLEGVKTKDRAILKCEKVSFKYPGTDRIIIQDATCYCSLNSRVAVVGANGAGKSTLIKILTGEAEPTTGSVWKHPNLRIAYVAQHAFHHLEQHLDKTPNEYIQWRYAIGEDREALQKETRQVSEEEQKKMEEARMVIDGAKRAVEKLLGRRKLKKGYEYEVQWVGLPMDQTTWLTRDQLEEMGFTKLVNEMDQKEAAAAGLLAKPLTAANVQKHLENVGLESEFATHSQIRGLSGGQKVKVVIGAAMWMNPHLLVLDEPTNYLDRDSLGALAGAIKEYGGGVLMISHNKEFTDALCPETWVVGGGRVDIKGDPAWANAPKEKVEFKVQEEMIDAFGNVVKIKAPKKKLSNKEKKARDKMRKARKERGEEVSDSDEDW